MNQELGKKLLSILKEEQVKKDEPMKSHTTFRVGGPADYFCDTADSRRSCEGDRSMYTGKSSLLYSGKWKQSSGIG